VPVTNWTICARAAPTRARSVLEKTGALNATVGRLLGLGSALAQISCRPHCFSFHSEKNILSFEPALMKKVRSDNWWSDCIAASVRCENLGQSMRHARLPRQVHTIPPPLKARARNSSGCHAQLHGLSPDRFAPRVRLDIWWAWPYSDEVMRIELEQEEDGRWIAEVPELPGALSYGQTRDEALARVKALALRVMADRLEHGERVPELADVFEIAA
jgi:predicted RNase H-like HicB family nuclease